ncbi:MAG: NADH dehydrogenase (quinone) subunit D [Candidatus Latescibacteria bacterium]|nr:NADH dehydrogenase (quinone) subunit D [Candidatus Latescibacterota bacterium]
MPTETMTLNFGPQHPATHGTLHMVLELDGERIVKVTPHIGYLHTGFEKIGEHRSYNQFVALSDRMNYLSPLSNNIGFATAVEKLMGITLTPRTEYIRTILAELSRLADHLVCVGTAALDIGAFTAFLYGFRAREELYDVFEAVTGTRLTTSYTRVGGLLRDVPPNFQEIVGKALIECDRSIDEIDKLLTHNRIWRDRTQGVGVVSADDALGFGATGPILRASGVDWDLRKNEPYLIYDQLDFDVVIGENGDVYDRYLVRMEEMRQSIKIVRQIIDKIPDGPISSDEDHTVIPTKAEVYESMESLIYHFKLTMEGHGPLPEPGEVYSSTEAPNGELGFYIVSDGSRHPYRLRVRPPSLFHFSMFPKLVPGHMLADVVAILGSMNIIAGELDR